MRNLKKVLSLALAFVMLLGMMVVGAGAATSFKDADKIENTEAVDVVSGIGVLLGDENGYFNPEGTLSRAEAAVVVAKLDLGEAFGNLETTNASTFSDVPAGYWGKAYIDYCFARGLIAGVGNNRYNPNGKVTGVEFALMVSRVLGYEDKAEQIGGADWEVEAAALARKAGLTVDVKLGSLPMTRDEMAQVAFNALKANMVEYKNGTIDITVGGTPVTIGGNPATPKASTGAHYDASAKQDSILQLCEEKFPLLKVRADVDDFERPVQVWTYNRKDICSDVVSGYEEYTTSVQYKTIRSALNANGVKVAYYKDGRPQTAPAANDWIGGNGVLTQAWFTKDDNGDDLVKLTEVHTYVGTVNAVNAKDEEATVAPKTSPNGEALDSATYDTTSAVVGDLITYQAAWDGENYDVVSAKPLGEPAGTGTLTEWNGTNTNGSDKSKGNGNFTVGGNKYEYSAHRVINNDNDEIWGYNVNRSELNVYVDDYTYAIYVDTVATEINYAAVIGVGNTNAYGSSTNGCTLLFADGTQKQVQYRMSNTNALSTNPSNNGSGGKQTVDDMIGDVVTYTVDSDDVYTLTLAGTTKDKGKYGNTVDQGVTAANESFTNGKSELKLGSGAGDTYYTTAKTVFFVCTGNSTDGMAYTAYTGYAKMPSFDPTEGITGYALVTNGSSKLVNAVYIAAPNLLGTAAASTYFVKQTNSPTASNSDGNYYILPAVVDGEVTDIKVSTTVNKDASFASKIGLFAITNVITNDKGIITSFTDNTNSVIETSGAFRASTVVAGTSPLAHTSQTVGTVRDPNGRAVLGIGKAGVIDQPNSADNATFWAYNDDTKVFVVDKDYKTISVSSPAAVVNDADDLVFAAIATDTKVLTNMFIVTQTEDSSTPSTPTPSGKITTAPVSSATEKNGLITIDVALVDKGANEQAELNAAIIAELGKMGYVPVQFPTRASAGAKTVSAGPFIASGNGGTKYYMVNITDYLTVTVDGTPREWFVYNTQPYTTVGDISKIGLAKSSNKGTGYIDGTNYGVYNDASTTKVGTATTKASLSYETGYVKVDQTVVATDIRGVAATDTGVIDAATVVTSDVTTPATDAYAKAGSDVKVTVTVTAGKTTTVKHDITLKYKLTPQGGTQTTETLSDVWVLPVGATTAATKHEYTITNVQGDIDDVQAFVAETMEAHAINIKFTQNAGVDEDNAEGMTATLDQTSFTGKKKGDTVLVNVTISKTDANTDPTGSVKITLSAGAWITGDTNGTSVAINGGDAKILELTADALARGSVTVGFQFTSASAAATAEDVTLKVESNP